MNSDQLSISTAAAGIRRRANFALAALLVSLPFVVLGAQAAVDGMRIAPERWVSKSHPQRQQFEAFRRDFEGNDVVLLSWDGCTVDDPRVTRLEQALLTPTDPALTERYRRDYDRVISGASALRRLMEPPLNLTREEAIERLTGILVGPDGQTSCVVVVLTYEGNDRRAETVPRLEEIAQEVTGLNPNQL
ncbi:MAG: hypothetical protein B7Z55_16080, partial [Planctomycetales bacterium 12-60-4]